MENKEIIGKDKSYKTDSFRDWPFKESFSYKNCICCFWINTPATNGFMRYVHVDFFSEVTDELLMNYKVSGFAPMGFYVINCSKEDSASIIDNIKKSQYYIGY